MLDLSKTRFALSLRKTGLGDRIVCLCAAWLFARYSHRTLVVDWRNSRYLPGDGNLFDYVFEPVEKIVDVPLKVAGQYKTVNLPGPVYPSAWTSLLQEPWCAAPDQFPTERDKAVSMILREQDYQSPTVVLNGCIAEAVQSFESARSCLDALRFKGRFVELANSYRRKVSATEPVIGLHVRHGNGGQIFDYAKFWSSFHEAIDRCVDAVRHAREATSQDTPVILCTDSLEVLLAIRSRVKNVFVRPKHFRAIGGGELHLGPDAPEVLDDAIVEMLILANCEILIRGPAGSFFTFYPAVMKPRTGTPPVNIQEMEQPYDANDALSPAILF